MHDKYRQTAHELSEAGLRTNSNLYLKVTSSSMTPLLRPGDHIVVKAPVIRDIQPGDLLLTRREDGFLTHRLVLVDSKGWHTKGDRNRLADEPVAAPAVLGMVIAFERLGKLRSLRTWFHLFLARLHAWLGWKEMTSHIWIGAWLAHLASRLLQTIYYL